MATVEDILMIKGPAVIVAASTATVMEAAKLMAEDNVGSVIVRDGGEVKGIFTERDLLRRVVARGKDPSSVLLRDVMSSPVRSCRLMDDIRSLTGDLIKEHVRHLAVIEDGALVGLVSLRDLLTAKLRDGEERIRAFQELAGQKQ